MKKLFLAAALSLGLTTSCLGPFNAWNGLRNWNAEVTDTDVVNELIFLGLNIIPVYGIVWIGDVLIFNTIGYWGDENPIGDPGPFPDSWGNK